MMNVKTYSELITLPTFEERFKYLELDGIVGETTFGGRRWINQKFYMSDEWKRARRDCIIRDCGLDIGVEGRSIYGKIIVHHIVPITAEDIVHRSEKLLSLENLITVSHDTHEAIHYSNDNFLLMSGFADRKPNDTCPWKETSYGR